MSKNPSQWRDALYRSVVLAMAISLHVLLFVLITRPVASGRNGENMQQQTRAALQLRIIALLKPVKSNVRIQRRASIAMNRAIRPMTATAVSPKKSAVATTVIPPLSAPESKTNVFGTSAAVEPATPPATATAESDGGFADRLRKAQNAHSVATLPGSDAPRVGDIQLIDPRAQGIGAVMRQAQRLFGITNHHCVDVDTWRSMTPQQLLARHITPSDVDRVDAENQCNRPMGLSF